MAKVPMGAAAGKPESGGLHRGAVQGRRSQFAFLAVRAADAAGISTKGRDQQPDSSHNMHKETRLKWCIFDDHPHGKDAAILLQRCNKDATLHPVFCGIIAASEFVIRKQIGSGAD